MERGETCILDLILRSLRHRRAVCNVVLAAYRVELTTTLNLIADAGMRPGDLDRVHDLAHGIATAAQAAGLSTIAGDALLLRRFTRTAGRKRGKKAVGAMLAAGLQVIDRILDTAAAAPRLEEAPALN